MKKNTVTKIIFALYCTVMLWLLFGQRINWVSDLPYITQLEGNINLIPFKTICRYLGHIVNHYRELHALKNLTGNIILFVPLGMIPQIWKKQHNFFRYIFTVALIILCVELIQLFTLLGCCDVDDFILNLTGAAIGFFLDRKRHIIKKQSP